MLTVKLAVIVSPADQEQDLLYFSMDPLSNGKVQNNIVVKVALSDLILQPWNRLLNMFVVLDTSYKWWAFRVTILPLYVVKKNRC